MAGVRYLNCYSGINPNIENNKHYFFATPQKYLTELESHREATILMNNYRINTNTAKLNFTNHLTDELAQKITYLIDYEIDNEVITYFRCYHVKEYLKQDYYIYMLEVDLWATYIYNCAFSNIHVTKCNRKINAKGLYDDVLETYEREERDANYVTIEENGVIYDTSVYIVYLVEYNVEQSALWGDQHISATGLFATNIGTLRGTTTKSAVEIAIDAIGGITKIANNMDARTLQAWLLPKWLVDIGEASGDIQTSRYYSFQSKGRDGTYTFNGYFVFPNTKVMDLIGNTFELNYQYFIGTRNNGYKTKRFVDKYMNSLGLYCFMGETNLQICIIQGDTQKDVTKDFEVTLTTNNGEVTGIRAVVNVIGKTLTSTFGFFASKKTFGSWGGASAFAKSASSEINTDPSISSAVGTGDASNLYWRAIWPNETDQNVIKKLNFPIIIERFKSTRDEEMHARMQGANFDEYISGFDYPLTKDLLGTGNHLTMTDTYIIATCRIDGIPLEAKTAIANKLANGIYYTYLT